MTKQKPETESASLLPGMSLFWRTNIIMVWRHCTPVTNYVDQQTLKPDDDYVLPHQRLWTFDVYTRLSTVGDRAFPVSCCSCSSVEQSSIARHCCPPLSPSSAIVLNHIYSHYNIPISDSSLICTVPAQWIVILDTIIDITFNILTFIMPIIMLTKRQVN